MSRCCSNPKANGWPPVLTAEMPANFSFRDHMMDQTHIMYAYWQQPMTNRYTLFVTLGDIKVTFRSACRTCRRYKRINKPSREQCGSRSKEVRVLGMFPTLFPSMSS